METAKEVTDEYARQIVKAVNDRGDDALYMVTELLKEFGAKAYKQGQQHLVDQIAKLRPL